MHQAIATQELIADLICAGHGAFYIENGYLDISRTNNEFVMYTQLGQGLANSLGVDIENMHYEGKSLAFYDTQNRETVLASKNYSPTTYPHVKVPNFTLLSGVTTRARIIEDYTGRILFETGFQINLKEMVEMFPQRKIHWAACAVVRSMKDSHQRFSENDRITVQTIDSIEKRKLNRNRVRFFPPSSVLTKRLKRNPHQDEDKTHQPGK